MDIDSNDADMNEAKDEEHKQIEVRIELLDSQISVLESMKRISLNLLPNAQPPMGTNVPQGDTVGVYYPTPSGEQKMFQLNAQEIEQRRLVLTKTRRILVFAYEDYDAIKAGLGHADPEITFTDMYVERFISYCMQHWGAFEQAEQAQEYNNGENDVLNSDVDSDDDDDFIVDFITTMIDRYVNAHGIEMKGTGQMLRY